jgi:uncharacterized protein YjdB
MKNYKKILAGTLGILLAASIFLIGCIDSHNQMYEPGDAVTGVKLDITSLSMAISEHKTLAATVEPSAAANQTVLWSSGNPLVATVSGAGLVTAVGNGTTTITVKSVDDPNKTAACTITVGTAGISISMVELNKLLLPLMIGQEETLLATVTLPPGANQALTWSSSNPAAATVSEAGLVRAAAEGTATITASVTDDPSISAICKVTVTLTEPEIPVVTGVSLNKTALELGTYSNELGHAPFEGQLIATVEPWGINQAVIWSSSNPSVAAVSDKGFVTATGKEKGTTIITVKSVDDITKTAACVVTVANLLEPGLDY